MAAEKCSMVPLALLLLLLTLSASCTCTQERNLLLQGYKLGPGDALAEGPYTLPMQRDCNLVLYHSGTAIWAFGTQGHGTECYFIMQTNGNAIVDSGSSSPLWATGTSSRNDGAHYIIFHNGDGNLVMYNGDGAVIWACGTNSKGLPMGVDGRQLLRSSSPTGSTASATDEANAAQAAALHH